MQFDPSKVLSPQEIMTIVYSILGYQDVVPLLLRDQQKYQDFLHNTTAVMPLPETPTTIFDHALLSIGTLSAAAHDQAIIELMRHWVERIDRFTVLLDDELLSLYQKLRTQLFLERGFSFEEYGHLFDHQLNPQDYHHFPAFTFLGIQTDLLRRHCIRAKSYDSKDYVELLSSLHIQGWEWMLQDFAAIVPGEELLKHCFITGKSGAGKTEIIKTLIYHIQRQTHHDHAASVLLVDPHGDLAQDVVAFHLNRDPSRLIYIDPYAFDGMTPHINPLQLPIDAKGRVIDDEQTIMIISEEISKVFQELIPDATLSNQMRTLLLPCVATLLRKGKSTIQELQQFMDDKSNAELLAIGKQSPNPSHRNFFATRFSDGHFKKTKSSVFTKIQSLLNSHSFYNLVMGESSVNIEQAMNQGKVIVFNLSKGKMGIESSEAFGRFVIATVQTIAQRRATMEERFRKPSFLFIDEFHNYITPSMQILLKEARKYRVPLILANQTLEDVRSPDMLSNILNNTEVKLVGRNGIKTLSEMAKELAIPVDRLQKMKKYHFMLKAGDRPAHQITTTTFLKQASFQLTDQERSAVMDYQRTQYYRPLHSEQVAQESVHDDLTSPDDLQEKDTSSTKVPPPSNSSPTPKFDL